MNKQGGALAVPLLIAGAVIGLSAVLLVGHDDRPAATRLVARPVVVDPAVQKLVDNFAADVRMRTDQTPTSADVYTTTRGVAAEVVEAATTGDDGADPVYVIVVRGKFVDHLAHRPPGSAAEITGEMVVQVIEARSNQPTDYGISGVPANLALMGEPQRVAVSR